MEISYWSKNTKDERFKYEELNELFKTSDVIFPVVAQNPQTQGIITDEMLKSMKKSVIFVSDIHEVYNHQLLLDMVKNNEIYGYAFEAGPERFNEYEGNVFASPELAWCTDGSMKRNAIGWVKNIMDAVNGNFSERIN